MLALLTVFAQLACVIEHFANLGLESGDDGGVEESVKTCKEYTADNYSDDDLYSGIYVALCLLGFDGCLYVSESLACSVLNVLEKLSHFINSFLRLIV